MKHNTLGTAKSSKRLVMIQDYSMSLDQLLMQEFRIWQKLLYFESLDREALLDCDLKALDMLNRRKYSELTALKANQLSRQDLLGLIRHDFGRKSDESLPGVLQWLLIILPVDEANRLMKLSKGIQTLEERFTEMVQSNYALADYAQGKLWDLRDGVGKKQQGLPEMQDPLLSLDNVSCSSESKAQTNLVAS